MTETKCYRFCTVCGNTQRYDKMKFTAAAVYQWTEIQ